VAAEHRDACVKAINAFLGQHPLVSLVVCSRVAEYQTLATQLELQGTVVIQPLTQQQVDAYLAQAGAPLAGVREALDEDTALYELLDTPLTLSVIALAYRDTPGANIRAGNTLEERRRRLFEAYTMAMFERHGAESPYTQQQTVRWLAWLARQLVDHNQTVFYLEWMQPDWLPKGVGR
jgi:hypothetical protein